MKTRGLRACASIEESCSPGVAWPNETDPCPDAALHLSLASRFRLLHPAMPSVRILPEEPEKSPFQIYYLPATPFNARTRTLRHRTCIRTASRHETPNITELSVVSRRNSNHAHLRGGIISQATVLKGLSR